MISIIILVLWTVWSRRVVYTFFEDLTGGISYESNQKVHLTRQDHLLVLQAWLRNWWSNGWNPQILRLSDAQNYPNYHWYHRRFAKYPTVNWRAYEMTCYLRWLAFADKGGGLFVDYDVMNFPIENIPKRDVFVDDGSLTSYPKYWPMVMFGGRKGIDRLIRTLAEYKTDETDKWEGFPHISDMIIVQKMAEHLIDNPLPNPAGLLHFSTAMNKSLLTRSEWIRQNLTILFNRRNRIKFIRQDQVDEAIDSLMDPLQECSSTQVHEDARLPVGEYPICDYRIADGLSEDQSEWNILIWEPIEESLLRKYASNTAIRRAAGDSTKTIQRFCESQSSNELTRRLARSLKLDFDKDLRSALDAVKKEIKDRQRMVLGFADRLLETKMVIEYKLGFVMPQIKVPYVPTTVKHSLKITKDAIEMIRRMNWADQELYEDAQQIWMECYNSIAGIEQQLDRYHDSPLLLKPNIK